MTIRAFTVRLYPTKEQEISFIRHIGCSRFIYNYMLELQSELPTPPKGIVASGNSS